MTREVVRGRAARMLVTGLSASAVAGVAIGGAALARTGTQPTAADAAVAAPAAVVAAPKAQQAEQPKPKNGYVFQNKPLPVGSLAAGQRVKIGPSVYFETRGTTWALLEPLPDKSLLATTGWRGTVGNTNIGDGTSPGIQGSGSVHSSVFRSSAAHTVVYTHGNKAWYAKVYRLQGIPGWVQSSAVLGGIGDDRGGRVTAGHKIGPPDLPQVAVFVYDAHGRLLTQFPDGVRSPLTK